MRTPETEHNTTTNNSRQQQQFHATPCESRSGRNNNMTDLCHHAWPQEDGLLLYRYERVEERGRTTYLSQSNRLGPNRGSKSVRAIVSSNAKRCKEGTEGSENDDPQELIGGFGGQDALFDDTTRERHGCTAVQHK